MLNDNRKKILLLSPDTTRPVFNQNGRLKTERFSSPLGLGYLAAVLKGRGYEVKVIDCLVRSMVSLRKEIRLFNPDVAGISCFTEHRGGSLRLARLIKEIDKKIPVVFGGSHATFMHRQLLFFYKEVDFCVLGEGEKTFPRFLDKFFSEAPKNYADIPGLAYRLGKRIVNTQQQDFILNLDTLPFPDREWVNPNLYHFPHKEAVGKKVASLVTARGCPYGCQFCSTSQFWGRRTRFRSIENVMKEIDFLWSEGFRVLNFLDDTFTLDQKRVQELCRQLMERKYEFLWSCSTRAGMISQDTAKLMRKAGCFSVTVGVESLSSKILGNINKKVKISQVIETFRILRKAGINSGALFMIGNVGEDLGTIKETIANLKKVKPDSIFTNLTQVYPSTQLYEIAKEKKLMNDDYWLKEKKAAPIYLAENTLTDLLRFEKMVWEGFFWQKRDLLRWFLRKSGIGSRIWPIISALHC